MSSPSWRPKGPVQWSQLAIICMVAGAVFGAATWLPEKVQAEVAKSPIVVTLVTRLDGIFATQQRILRALERLEDKLDERNDAPVVPAPEPGGR